MNEQQTASQDDARLTIFGAGLGDVIRMLYKNKSYQYVCDTKIHVPIVVCSHNPFTIEIFKFHRNASNFILYDLAHKYDEFLAKGLRGPDINKAICQFAGLDYGKLVTGDVVGYKPTFDAPDNIESSGHIVFQPFAGNANYRSLPPKLMEEIIEVLRSLPYTVYIVTRSYIRFAGGSGDKAMHANEDARHFAGGNIIVRDDLSVPAALNLIKTSAAYIGSWSSLQQAAWFEDKPVAVLYPEKYHDVEKRTGYAFGLDRENCFHSEFNKVDLGKLKEWITRWC